jgi:hypothetical protein
LAVMEGSFFFSLRASLDFMVVADGVVPSSGG